jgi:hypothetical protein
MYEDPLVRALTSFGESGSLATLTRNLPARVAAPFVFSGPFLTTAYPNSTVRLMFSFFPRSVIGDN